MKLDPIPSVRFLDPRPPEEARERPIADSANIPFADLAARMSELPPKNKVVRVVGPEALAAETVAWLRRGGRKAVQITTFTTADRWAQGRLWAPNHWLWTYLTTARVHEERPGSALDLGCGGGRDAVYLAAHGWRVLAVDNLPDGIERGRELASHYLDPDKQSLIEWRVADVIDSSYDPGVSFDLITSFFLFDRRLILNAKEWLAPHGVLLIEAFTTLRREKEGKPSSPDRVVKPGEMHELLDGLEIVRLEEGEQSHGHTVRAWACKR